MSMSGQHDGGAEVMLCSEIAERWVGNRLNSFSSFEYTADKWVTHSNPDLNWRPFLVCFLKMCFKELEQRQRKVNNEGKLY